MERQRGGKRRMGKNTEKLNYKILSHTSDLKLQVFGRTKKELLENTLKALALEMGILFEEKRVERKIKIQSYDLESLIVDFFTEILYFLATKKEFYTFLKIERFSQKILEASLLGKKVKDYKLDVKAVTYHDLKIEKTKKGWSLIILFDI